MKAFEVDADGKHGSVECDAAGTANMTNGRVDVAEAAARVRWPARSGT